MEDVTAAFAQYVSFLFTFLLWIVVIIFVAMIGTKISLKIHFRQKLKKHLAEPKHTFLFVKISPSNEEKENAMEEFLRGLHRVLPSGSTLSLEMTSSDQFLRFCIVVAKHNKNLIESQLYAQYPEAEIEEVEEYLSDLSQNTAIEELHFKHASMYPFATYKELDEDFLKTLSSMLSKTEQGDKVVLQFALKRVGSKFWERGYQATQYKLFGSKGTGEVIHPATAKLAQDLYIGKLRIAYTSSNKEVAKAKLKTLFGLFKSVKGSHNEIKQKRFTLSNILPQTFKARMVEKGDFWTSAEIATIYHFPYKGAVVSNVVNTTSKRAPAPDILPREGIVDPKEVSFIGETNYRNDRMRFGIKRFDRRRHLYVVGKTGSGKSRLLQLLLVSDIQQGHGCCLIDPHGDLADELLKFVPKERINDVVYVNPTDRDFPIGFNPLEPTDDHEARQHLSRFFIAIFKKLFAENWNSRMEHLIRYITLALLETPDSNVLGIPRLLSDTTFRQRVIQQVQDPVVKSFWTNEFSANNEQFITAAAVPILNKVGQFISNPIIRNMVGQRQNMLDFESFMNEGKIVIINLSKGKLGEENMGLMGSMFITKIQQAALARAKIPEEERKDFYFYVDEFQNFATDAFSSILSEARKYRLDLTIAHQYIAQLPEDVKATAFGNVGTIITFAIGGDDAAYLAKEFSPTFTPDDMINLNTREMYIRMSVDGKVAPPFSARTIDTSKPPFDFSGQIIDNARLKYGKNRVAVENDIAKWSNSAEAIVSGGGNNQQFPEPIL